MRKLAVFVEGYTELLLVDKLISEVANRNEVVVVHNQILGGGKMPIKHITLNSPAIQDTHTHQVLIVNCGGEHLVAQRIREELPSLTRAGYERVIGIRDVFPNFTKVDIPKLQRNLYYGIKTNLAPVKMVLAVMETEAWFLAEHNHFLHVDPRLTVDFVENNLGFHPENDDMSERASPAADLEAVYQLVGKEYRKGHEFTPSVCDYAYMYTVLRDKFWSLEELLASIDAFLSRGEGPIAYANA